MLRTNNRSINSTPKRARTSSTKVAKKKRSGPKTMKVAYAIGNVFAPCYRNTMHYNFVGSMAVTSGAYTTYKFAANGLYKPDLSVAATQPLGFSILQGIYEYYTVLSSKIRVEFSTTSGNQNACLVGVLLDDDNVAPTTIAQAINQQYSSSMMGNLFAEKQTVLSKYFSAKVQFGNDNPVSDPDVSATGGANPANLAAFVIFASDASNATLTVYFKVSVVYEVFWHERKTIAFP